MHGTFILVFAFEMFLQNKTIFENPGPKQAEKAMIHDGSLKTSYAMGFKLRPVRVAKARESRLGGQTRMGCQWLPIAMCYIISDSTFPFAKNIVYKLNSR
jgi:hypothetical protein